MATLEDGALIKLEISFDPFKKAHANLKQYKQKIANPAVLANTLQQRMIASNKARALKGNDKDGKPFAPLRPITLATRRGPGKPLSPRGSSSRIIANFYCNYRIVNGKIQLTAGWDNMDFMKYHITGYRHRSGRWVPARNANGVPANLKKTMLRDAKEFYKLDGTVKFNIQEIPEAG